MQRYLFLLLLIATETAFAQNDEASIREVLAQQQECWNRGDVDCFMESYWKSDQLMFIGGNGITSGWQATLDNYKVRYPDRTAMGELKFDILRMDPLGGEYYFMVGRFHLSRTIGDLEGIFTLVWQKMNGEWVIISDHTG